MAELILCSAAERDYTEALTWYADRSIPAAERFEEAMQEALGAIAADPERFPRCDDRHRYYLMRRFPYQIIFRHEVDRVVVMAVAHTSRQPRYWDGR